MNQIDTLSFPDTVISPAAAGLLLFFNSVVHYLPTEDQGGPAAQNPLYAGKLCTGYPPAPLRDDLQRFNRLLKDMSLHQEEFLGQLSVLLSDSHKQHKMSDSTELSTSALIAALTGKNMPSDNGGREELWQSRLLLKLAEAIDRQDMETREGLNEVDALEKSMLTALHGGEPADDDGFGLQAAGADGEPLPSKYRQAYQSLTRLRSKAWARLFLVDQSEKRPWLLSTSDPEAYALLADRYEAIMKKQPTELFSLMLPDSSLKPGSDYIRSRNRFRDAAAPTIDFFSGILTEAAKRGGNAPATAVEMQLESWNAALREDSAWTCSGSTGLKFFAFNSISVSELLKKTFKLSPRPQGPTTEKPNTILCLLYKAD